MVGSPLWHARGPDGEPLDLIPEAGASPVPPRLGEHSRSVLRGDLGMSVGEIEALVSAGVVRGGQADG